MKQDLKARTRTVRFAPAYDRRGETPNYGQCPMHIIFVLKGYHGAIALDINASWYLDRKQPARHIEVSNISYHDHFSPETLYESEDYQINSVCEWLDGNSCISGTLFSAVSPVHDRILDGFLREGVEWMWERLEEIYLDRYEKIPLPEFYRG